MTQTAGANIANRHYYLSGEDFYPGRVYSQLKAMEMDYVVGMDIGHGESLVYLFDRTNSTVKRKQMNFNDDAKVASIIGFRGKDAVIGREARGIPGFIQHFKVEPALWNNLADKNYTHRDLMVNYIRALWQGVLHFDPNLYQHAGAGKVLITVGCPSSPAWTNERAVTDYQELVREATGCAHVAILPESTAAIMSAILDVNEMRKDGAMQQSVDLSGGLAVVDAGSSTVDFTYVLLGRKLITRSIDVAGHDLDVQMLKVALEKNQLTMADIPQEQLPDILVQLREIKEAFYPHQQTLGIRTIAIWGRDAQGRADRNLFDGKMLTFVVNQEFMDEAMSRKSIQRGPFEPAMSWLEHCGKFIEDCAVLIPKDEKGNIICDKVIVTGGTSYVRPLYDLVCSTYTDKKVFSSRDRSASVAKGLCYAKSLELKGSGEVDGYKQNVEKLMDKQYESFLGDINQYIAKEVCNVMQDVLKEHTTQRDVITAGALVDEINSKAQANPKISGKECRQKVESLFIQHFQAAESKLQEEVNMVSRNIYGANMSCVPETPKLSAEELKEIAKKINITNMIGNSWINTLVAVANLSTISGILWFLALVSLDSVILAPLFPVFAGLAFLVGLEGFQQKLMEFIVNNKTVLRHWLLQPILNKLTNAHERAKLEKKTAAKSAESMKKNGVLKKEFYTVVGEQAEVLLGKVLYMTYDEEPDLR